MSWNFRRQIVSGFCVAIAAFSWGAAQAAPIDLKLVIQPIQICNDDGTSCANPDLKLFEAEGDKIWSQAGIDLEFLPWITQNSTTLNILNMDTEFGGPAAGNIIRMLFVNQITHCGGAGAGIFGCGYVDANGLAIADNVFSFNGGIGRLDTIAHELGHNLGLGHNNFGAGGALNLMTSGGTRTIPGTINDIFPDGLTTDQLTQEQIDKARSSSLLVANLVPLPGTLVLIALGFVAFGVQRRRRPVL